ncbi:hypothetical protein ABIE52_006720 [Rhodococcus sp. OAS809]|uniref:hypothetical protein n=1 Tax=Rhodococcus sp. OAS809 TaxID=2663874 RepID=UPI00178A3CC9
MTFQKLVSSDYAKDLIEAAAVTVISCENIHRDKGESATDALAWAIDKGGLFTYEDALPLLVDQALNIHEDQRNSFPVGYPVSLVTTSFANPNYEDRMKSVTDSDPFTFAECLPTGSDEEDRVLSLLSLGPS